MHVVLCLGTVIVVRNKLLIVIIIIDQFWLCTIVIGTVFALLLWLGILIIIIIIDRF